MQKANDISKFYQFIKTKCAAAEYQNVDDYNIMDIILEYCGINRMGDDEIMELIELIKANKVVYQFIETEARRKRQLIDSDYNKCKATLNKLGQSRKTNLFSIFKITNKEPNDDLC